ncbi:polyphosphate kinase 2 [Polynucleobacter sp. QLW-P1DATA-2]|jgi:polyphosphate kinase 2|uniref:polyphosphate kinase 2 n=1 Tax=unclassified Polynucleobacter TaxID=2640945 RepID=UPI0008F9340D|nr:MULTISPECIES: polyphosphate kinase 2 [unclassified Polynucleobacter]OIM98789.1 polyphosphate kinase 2 [Polynucleobacter sp. MWH-Tro8-2-5-gr]OIN00622.1 polyphosphate kinase 2 [Polynucleobacter sp. QLW-P1DATA-2]
MGKLKKLEGNDVNYDAELRLLQIELVKVQRQIISSNSKLLIILEGRDTAGKDGTIKCITEHLSPRETHVVALGIPTSRESGEWYFQRYVAELPSAGEIILFNRSWYNRAGVEKVMGFCTDIQYQKFMDTVNEFESLLVGSGIQLIKYYLDIDKKEQARRMESRKTDPLKQWKVSPIDQQAQKKWKAYSIARDLMLKKTSSADAPWTVIDANNKKLTHLNLIRDLLSRINYPGKDKKILNLDPNIVSPCPPLGKKPPKVAP